MSTKCRDFRSIIPQNSNLYQWKWLFYLQQRLADSAHHFTLFSIDSISPVEYYSINEIALTCFAMCVLYSKLYFVMMANARLSGHRPTCQSAIAALSISHSSAIPAFCTSSMKIASAMGDRQTFPESICTKSKFHFQFTWLFTHESWLTHAHEENFLLIVNSHRNNRWYYTQFMDKALPIRLSMRYWQYPQKRYSHLYRSRTIRND